MSHLTMSASFECAYLCYGFTAIILFFNSFIAGTSEYDVFRHQILKGLNNVEEEGVSSFRV